MSSSASTDTFPALPADVAEVRRAAEAVPQALDRLSEEARTAWASRLAADVAEVRRRTACQPAPPTRSNYPDDQTPDDGRTEEPHHALMRCVRWQSAEKDRLRQQIATLTSERDEARAENASLLAVVPPGTHVARVEWGVHAEVTRQRDEILRLTRERDEARASITRFAEAAAAHDANADVFVDDEYHISTRALVEEFCRGHGHPLTHEWATAKINAPDGGAPTAPDVGSTTSAPAAGAADPRPVRTPDEIRAWAAGLFGEVP